MQFYAATPVPFTLLLKSARLRQTVEVGLGQPAEDTSGDFFRAADLQVHRSHNLQAKPELQVCSHHSGFIDE